jgi:bifunctional non-homologous end joining protein LigD
MLATLARADAALRDEDYAFEVKYDGFRALAALSARRVALQSRNGLDLAGRFPRVATAVATLDLPEAVLDGEIVALDRHGVGRFEELQAAGKELRYMVFDLLWLDGTDLRSRPLRDRRELLESALSQAQLPLAVAERLESTRAAALQTARSRKLEGMIAKRLDAPYVGARSRAWLKLKVQQSQELVAIGYEPISSGERAVGALLLAVADGRGRFSYAGKVGTGFDMATRRRLRTLLDAQHVDRPPVETRERLKEARWSRPKLVAEVRFTEWTRDGGLRHPVFAGLREDKSPQECVREAAD